MMDTKLTATKAVAEEAVGYEKGAKMVKNYFDATQTIQSNTISKEVLLEVLSQPGVEGVNVISALDANGEYQPVVVGVDANGQHVLHYVSVNAQGKIVKQKGIVAIVRSTGDGPTTHETPWF